jgi:predicted anti-sigma-YlaC factor YlaD
MNIRETYSRLMDCRRTQESASRALDDDLGFRDRLYLWAHLRICWSCRRFAKQLRIIRRMLGEVEERFETGASEKLSPEARSRLAKELENAEREDSETHRKG